MSWTLALVLIVAILSVTGLIRQWLEYLDARSERQHTLLQQRSLWEINELAPPAAAEPPSPN